VILLLLLQTTEFLEGDAKTLFEQSTSRHVRLAGDALEPEVGEVFEDDGPAAGFSYKPNEEVFSGDVRVRKELLIPDPRATSATLLVGPGGDLAATVNGKGVKLEGARTTGKYWQAYPLDPSLLKAGLNEIVLHGKGKVWIARKDDFPPGVAFPNRSARSADGGKTWERVEGEYYVRLFLDRPRSGATLTLPVIDAANLGRRVIASPVSEIGSVKISPPGAIIRSGPTPIPGPGWADGDGGRYLQIRYEITAPLKSVRMEVSPKRPLDWTKDLKVLEWHNAPLLRTSLPFEYEPFGHPRLKELRERFRLDDLAKDAASEFELVTRLAAWASRLWTDGHLKEGYPAWDALEILKPHADGKPVGGFCQQYNLVFLQACESFGIVGRCVSIGPGDHGSPIRSGHEVVEIWSNNYRKWVYVDGQAAWYFTDGGDPLSLLELRERQLRGREVRCIEIAKTKHVWKGIADFPPFIELRMIPRSNFLEKPSPLPLNQGMRGWFWTGHVAWTDREAQPSLLYGNRVSRRAEWEWTLNTVRLWFEAGKPGELRVHLETVTPGLETCVVDVNGDRPVAADGVYTWTLRKGRNTLHAKARNVAGREGPTSRVVFELPE
jgi:hypothetical protein